MTLVSCLYTTFQMEKVLKQAVLSDPLQLLPLNFQT